MTRFLFWFQIVMAYLFSIPLIINIYNGKVEGLTQAMFVIFLVFMTMGFSLALSSYRESRSEIRLQTLVIFCNWLILNAIIVSMGFYTISWSNADSVFTLLIALFSLVTIIKYKGIKNPMSRGWILIWCKALPQLWLTYTMIFVYHSASGLAFATVIAGHMTSLPRILQIFLSGKKEGWDGPTKSLLIGESANVTTWWIVTFAWCYLSLV
jgi:hypothetical protein